MITLKRVDVVDAQPYVGSTCSEAIDTLSVVDVARTTRTPNEAKWCRHDVRAVPARKSETSSTHDPFCDRGSKFPFIFRLNQESL